MLRIYKAMSSFKSQSSFATWAYRITMNTCLDELRRRKVRTSASLDAMLETGWAPSDETDTPEHHALRSEQRRALERLSRTFRMICARRSSSGTYRGSAMKI